MAILNEYLQGGGKENCSINYADGVNLVTDNCEESIPDIAWDHGFPSEGVTIKSVTNMLFIHEFWNQWSVTLRFGLTSPLGQFNFEPFTKTWGNDQKRNGCSI